MQQNLGKLLSSLNQMQKRMDSIQAEMAAATFDAEAGGGLARVSMSGKGELLRVWLDPAVMSEDAETIADLVTVAARKAFDAKEAMAKERLGTVASGLMPLGIKLPGLGL
jgi:DNA-binding YbaB/EbfC family protein